MSRIGKQLVEIEDGVDVAIDGRNVTVKGPHGSLSRDFHAAVALERDGTGIRVSARSNDRTARSMHGLSRTLLANMVKGVKTPFKKTIEVQGIGYRAEMVGKAVKLMVGLSHEVLHTIPEGVECKIEKQTLIHLTSPDKALVGQIAAALRSYRPCEPYKGKGMKYSDERIRRKEGKTGAG